MTQHELITAERLRELLQYDPETGLWTWLVPHGRWGRIPAGVPAGCVQKHGCVAVHVERRQYKTHRLAWLWMTGTWPTRGIDHVDGNPLSNRWLNLRLASQSENMQNQCIRSDNTSGHKGVYLHRGANKWQAQIKSFGAYNYLGLFSTREEAASAYASAADKLNGEFARIS